ncbi:MAG: DUF4926 domain-containing protein [Planctomycetota bacterium]
MFREHEQVVLAGAITDKELEAGDVGTVVHVYRDGKAYEVEFLTLSGETVAVTTVPADKLRPVRAGEITHARPLAGG